jgi:tryptophan synthase alpha chain
MNRINQLFQQREKRILSVYFTAGFPHADDTGKILKSLQANGIDMVEVGIPFSDPMADGLVIQESSTIALRNGMNMKLLFSQLTAIADEIRIPLIMMGYLNPIMQYGFENFCRDCHPAGVSGIIIPDLPFDIYLNHYKSIADKYNLRMIMLITPETSEERIRLIDAHTEGFIYVVSSVATTGAQKSFDEKKQAYFRRINNMGLRNPRLIGFGISNRETLDAAFANASGAIIGSKFISLLKDKKSPEEAVVSLGCELQITGGV